jgi:hypothetical protein
MVTTIAIEKLENYPFKIICVSATLTIISYFLGTLVFYVINPFLALVFLLLAISTIVVSMKLRCTHCYYFGKYCNFGLGKLTAKFFNKGDPDEFSSSNKVVPTAILSFGTMILPVIAGIGLIILDFSLVTLSLLLIYIVFGILPNFFVRGNFCDKCVQGQLGCPTYKQMMKGNEK